MLNQVDKILEDGQAQQKKSMFEEAIAIYTKASDLIAAKKDSFSHLKKALTLKEANIFY